MLKLESIIKIPKKVIKKGKNVFRIGLASLVLFYVSGCETTSYKSWEESYRTVRKERQYIENLKQEDRITYKINDIETSVKSKELKAKITEEKYEDIYGGIRETEQKEYKEVEISQDNSGPVAGGIIGTLLGIGIGLAIGSQMHTYEYENGPTILSPDVRKETPNTAGAAVVTMLTTAGGLGLGVACGGKGKTSRKYTGRTKTEPTDITHIIMDQTSKPRLIYTNKESSNIKVKISPIYLFEVNFRMTNEDGTVTFLFSETELPYNKSFSKESLEQKLKSSKLVLEIKEQYRNDLVNEILKRTEEKQERVVVETIEESTDLEKKVNDSKSTIIGLYKIPEEKIYTVLEDFINQEINSNIVNWRARVKDATSGMPVEDARMEIKTNAPSKEELIKKYFEGNLVVWGITKVKDYIRGEEIFKEYDKDGILILPVYKLSTYETETQHKHYVRVKVVYEGEPKRTIHMSKDPNLVRVLKE